MVSRRARWRTRKPQRQGEQEKRLEKPPRDNNYTMNVTIVDAHSLAPKTDPREKERTKQKVAIISGWLLFHLPGNHTDALQRPGLSMLVGGLRNAVADAIEICRSAVGVVDMRAINIDVVDRHGFKPGVTHQLVETAHKLVRPRQESLVQQHVNVTQVKAVYEVRIFPQMRTDDQEVSRRVDRFQVYSKFADLNRLLARSLSEVDRQALNGIMLDDVGYASRHMLWRSPLGPKDLADCAEEGLLHDARQVHQCIVAVSLVLVALITCAGSTVFTIKHVSTVPSRINPLIAPGGGGGQ